MIQDPWMDVPPVDWDAWMEAPTPVPLERKPEPWREGPWVLLDPDSDGVVFCVQPPVPAAGPIH